MPEHTFATPLGHCALAWNDAGLTHFRLPVASGAVDAATPTDGPTEAQSPPAWVQAIAVRVQRHLAGELQDFSDLRYDFSSQPDFTRDVLRATLEIKAGHTATYGDLAATLGFPPATSRAVGTALGSNPWPLLIPCHRIVAASGKLTGYSGPGGIDTKVRLLALEGARLL